MAINYEADKRNIAIFHVLTIPRIFLKAHTVFR